MPISALSRITKYCFAFFFIILFGGCAAKMMNKNIARVYGNTTDLNKNRYDYINISSPLITGDDKTSTATSHTKNFLPLLLYWKWNTEVDGILNPKVPINSYSASLTSYLNSKGLKSKLNGGKLEVVINRIPSVLAFRDDHKLLVFILFYVHLEKTYIKPIPQDMLVNYKITKADGAVVSGDLTIPDANKIVKVKFFQSARSATAKYLEGYDDNLQAMAKYTGEKIMALL